MLRAALLALAALAACGPIPVAEAERACLDQALLAQRPRGEVGIGINSEGRVAGKVAVTVTSDYIAGRDPSAVFDTCVFQRSGVPPTRPLYSFPEWKE
jgi:hypothetical protein